MSLFVFVPTRKDFSLYAVYRRTANLALYWTFCPGPFHRTWRLQPTHCQKQRRATERDRWAAR